MINYEFAPKTYSQEVGTGAGFIQPILLEPDKFQETVEGYVIGSTTVLPWGHYDSSIQGDVDIVSLRQYPYGEYRIGATSCLAVPNSEDADRVPFMKRATYKSPSGTIIDHIVVPDLPSLNLVFPGTLFRDNRQGFMVTPDLRPDQLTDPELFIESGGRVIHEILRCIGDVSRQNDIKAPREAIEFLYKLLGVINTYDLPTLHQLAARFHRNGEISKIAGTPLEATHHDFITFRNTTVWFQHITRVADQRLSNEWSMNPQLSYYQLVKSGLIPFLFLNGYLQEGQYYSYGGGVVIDSQVDLEDSMFDIRHLDGIVSTRNAHETSPITPLPDKSASPSIFTQKLVAFLLSSDPNFLERILYSRNYLPGSPEAEQRPNYKQKRKLVELFLNPKLGEHLLTSQLNPLRNAVVRMVAANLHYYVHNRSDLELLKQIVNSSPYVPLYELDHFGQFGQFSLNPAMGLPYTQRMKKETEQQSYSTASFGSDQRKATESEVPYTQGPHFETIDPETLVEARGLARQLILFAFRDLFSQEETQTQLAPEQEDFIVDSTIIQGITLEQVYAMIPKLGFNNIEFTAVDRFDRLIENISNRLVENGLFNAIRACGHNDFGQIAIVRQRANQYRKWATNLGPHNRSNGGMFYHQKALELDAQLPAQRFERFARSLRLIIENINNPGTRVVVKSPGFDDSPAELTRLGIKGMRVILYFSEMNDKADQIDIDASMLATDQYILQIA